MPFVLHKWAPGWGLPSVSAACTCVEAYLRLAGADVQVQEYSGARSSPTGQLPALERDDELVKGGVDEDSCAQAIIDHLAARGPNLDAHLSAAKQSELAAFSALVHARLEPATLASAWAEGASYRGHTRAAYGAGLPLPLSVLMPWVQRRAALHRLAPLTPEQAYIGAGKAYAAIAARLRSSSAAGGHFFFGVRPCSLDALLFAHLLHHRSAPVSAPELRQQFDRHPALVGYVEHILQSVFAAPLPPAPAITSAEWGARAEPGNGGAIPRAGAAKRPPKSAEEEERERNNRLWMGGVAAAMAAYVLLSGTYLSVGVDDEYDEYVPDGGAFEADE
ncbi:hypothetical protein WJX81_006095 [Elliptochloris bilobata]|uniref:Metaxin n=1 Tax=Elliptochloris bilobata TaxID=381761 RepID=A0AAW1RR27_9CHLO